jgi:hypothetical protein
MSGAIKNRVNDAEASAMNTRVLKFMLHKSMGCGALRCSIAAVPVFFASQAIAAGSPDTATTEGIDTLQGIVITAERCEETLDKVLVRNSASHHRISLPGQFRPADRGPNLPVSETTRCRTAKCATYANFRTTEAVFGEVTVEIISRLKANVGVRVDHSVSM